MLDKIKALGGSRKFWAGIIGVVLTYINSQLKVLDDSQMLQVNGLIAAYIVGIAVNPK
jgi:hypothetical protein